MKNKLFLTLLIAVFFNTTLSFSQNISDYLILQDISSYKISKPEKLIPGFQLIGGPRTYDSHGIIGATGHFPYHSDKNYTVMYLGETDDLPSPTVQVTQHAGSDSDRWLLHEVEDIFRSNKSLGALVSGTEIREINSNKIYNWISYAWISGNVLVYITWTPNPAVQNPEPLEVVQAYLQKFPSTIPTTLVLDRAHNEQWIKDEMERRLWLGDKWFAQLQVGDVELTKVLRQSVDHMNVFLDYREKYYGIASTPEKRSLWEYLQAKDDTSIRNKLADYKSWWNTNKAGAINIP